MTLHDILKDIKAILSVQIERNATGRYIIMFDMNQGGIGSCRMYGTSKTPKNEAIFITHNGTVKLEELS